MPLDFFSAFWAYAYFMEFRVIFSGLFDNPFGKIEVFIRYPQLRPSLYRRNFAHSRAQILICDHGFDAMQFKYVLHVLS